MRKRGGPNIEAEIDEYRRKFVTMVGREEVNAYVQKN
jgi:hypothetical protein